MEWKRVTLDEGEVEAMYARWGHPCGLFAPVPAGEYVSVESGFGVRWLLDPCGIKHAYVRIEPPPDGRLLEAVRRCWQDPHDHDGEWDMAARTLCTAMAAHCEASLALVGNLGKKVEGEDGEDQR